MVILKNIKVLIAVARITFFLSVVEGSPYTITDDRARSLDVTPVLGRGFSVATNSFYSTCLNVDQMTSPSYNYDHTFIDFTTSEDVETTLAGKVSSSFGYHEIKTEVALKSRLNTFNTETFMVVAAMRIERYYSSLKDETSTITKDARNLLDKQDYIGFFKSCGSVYVRSIRRAQEITSIFNFNSPSRDLAQEFAAGVNAQTQGSKTDTSFASQSKFLSIAGSLDIKILGFGLGLNHDGSDILTSTSLEQYSNIMRFSFKSFTQLEDTGNVGMVYALEFIPWVDSAEFQVASSLLDHNIEIPLPRSLIPKAKLKSDNTNLVFMNNDSTRSQFECKNSLHRIDKYGYCCEGEDLFNNALQQYNNEEQDAAMSNSVCKPLRKLDKSVVKQNMSNNGEFVARLDSVIQYKLNQLFTLQTCLASIHSFSEKYDHYILKSRDTAKYDTSIGGRFTVKELKTVLDPFNDYGLIKHMSNELDEFIDMFYRPCIAAIFGTNIGSSPDIEAKYFMAHGWLTHGACSKISCLADNMRWNRDGSGCIESLITGSKAPLYDYNDSECKKDDEANPIDDFEVCNYKSKDLINFQESVNTCWEEQTVPYYLMEYFCMPEMTTKKVDEDQQTLLSHTCVFYPNSCSRKCSTLTRIEADDDNIRSLVSANIQNEDVIECFDTSKVTVMTHLFQSNDEYNGDLSCWDVSSVTTMLGIFHYATSFNGDVSSWDVSSVGSMYGLFHRASLFNRDVSSWDVSSVTDMYAMFNYDQVFNSDVSSWDVSSVTNMYGMFYLASLFNSDLSSWDVSSVTSIHAMFAQIPSFNSDMSSWDVASVTDMHGVFNHASSFNSDLSSWDVSLVTSIFEMFRGATIFNQELCSWDTESVETSTADLFTGSLCTLSRCLSCTG